MFFIRLIRIIFWVDEFKSIFLTDLVRAIFFYIPLVVIFTLFFNLIWI